MECSETTTIRVPLLQPEQIHYSVHFIPRKRETKAKQKVGSARFPTRGYLLSVAFSGFQSDLSKVYPRLQKRGKETIALYSQFMYLCLQSCIQFQCNLKRPILLQKGPSSHQACLLFYVFLHRL